MPRSLYFWNPKVVIMKSIININYYKNINIFSSGLIARVQQWLEIHHSWNIIIKKSTSFLWLNLIHNKWKLNGMQSRTNFNGTYSKPAIVYYVREHLHLSDYLKFYNKDLLKFTDRKIHTTKLNDCLWLRCENNIFILWL